MGKTYLLFRPSDQGRYVMNGGDGGGKESPSFFPSPHFSSPETEKNGSENLTVVFCNSSESKVVAGVLPPISMSGGHGSSSSSSSSSYEYKTEEKMGEEECDEDEILANFLESEILSVDSSTTTSTAFQQQQHEDEGKEEEEEEPKPKVRTSNTKKRGCDAEDRMSISPSSYTKKKKKLKMTIGSSSTSPPVIRHLATTSSFSSCYISGSFSNIPPELFHHIIKFLSSEDLISCSLVCRFMNFAASDDSLWRRLYCMRWGLASPAGKLHTCPWKKLYIQRDKEDMVQFIRNTPSEFKEYYIQMQAAKRSQAPLPSQVNDDRILLDKTVSDQVSIWKSKRGLSDEISPDHVCSGNTCTYYQIGDVFLCEKTGTVHVCDDTCREVILDPADGVLVCTISGHCFDRLLSPEEELDTEQQAGMTDEAEPFMGSGRFARAYLLGYNCADEKELEATLRFC